MLWEQRDRDSMQAEIDRLREELHRYQWRPIETAPKNGAKILLWGTLGMALGSWQNRDSTWFLSSNIMMRDVDLTHWMPLPPKPKEKAQ